MHSRHVEIIIIIIIIIKLLLLLIIIIITIIIILLLKILLLIIILGGPELVGVAIAALDIGAAGVHLGQPLLLGGCGGVKIIEMITIIINR